MANVLLNVADIRRRSCANGPGWRSVVWVQGCTLPCPDCFNPHTHAHAPVRLLDPAELGHHLLKVPGVQGLTISGGEPFEQAKACAILAETYRATGRSVMVYSGYRWEHLQRWTLPAVKRFLRSIDLLVAGPFIKSLHGDGTLWRGSSNQTLHFFTDRMKDAPIRASPAEPAVEITLDGRLVSSTGFPDEQDLAWIEQLSGAANARDDKTPVHPRGDAQ